MLTWLLNIEQRLAKVMSTVSQHVAELIGSFAKYTPLRYSSCSSSGRLLGQADHFEWDVAYVPEHRRQLACVSALHSMKLKRDGAVMFSISPTVDVVQYRSSQN